MRDFISKFILFLADFAVIVLSIILAFLFREMFNGIFENRFEHDLNLYITFAPIYIFTLTLFFYDGIYTKRYDFWHETREVVKSLLLSFVILMAYLAMTKSIESYSRATIIFIFCLMIILIPIEKIVLKRFLFKLGLWAKDASIYRDDPFIQQEIFSNTYLGYRYSKDASTIFINSAREDRDTLSKVIDDEILQTHEVIFVPLIDQYNLTQSTIYYIFNSHTNLFVFRNRLKSRYRQIVKYSLDLLGSILILPFILPVMGVIVWLIKREEPEENIIFKQKRLGKDGKLFTCYKFRTMYQDGDRILSEYLEKNPDERRYFEEFHKCKNDPRVTKIGKFLRRSSLDELPQIFNVLKFEMSLVGPRPYMVEEVSGLGEYIDTVLNVRPGITGLWQVSGRGDLDFENRIELDVWYIRNWSVWLDIVILFKTVKVVLKREGAY